MAYFAIPVSKEVEKKGITKIKDQDAHLTWYNIADNDKEFPNKVNRTPVEYRNQITDFEPAFLTTGDLNGILLPAQKIKGDHKFPDNLDHYLCYAIVEGITAYKEAVKLNGQYTKDTPQKARGPVFFCVPCSKDNKEIKNKEDHLVAYKLDMKDIEPTSISAKDQWGTHDFDIISQAYLLVPTKKKPKKKDQD